MQIIFVEDHESALDGIKVSQLKKGYIVELKDDIAARYIERGVAKQYMNEEESPVQETKVVKPVKGKK